MSSRLDPSWRVEGSVQTHEGDRCVDVFVRGDGSYGFEEFRRDPEDMGRWTPLHYFSDREYTSESGAWDAARRAVPWLGSVIDR
jgi:hypothetical protein